MWVGNNISSEFLDSSTFICSHYIQNLNQKFQDYHVDIRSIGTILDDYISMLHKWFLGSIFQVSGVNKSYFLVKAQGGTIEFVDNMSMVHLYPLRFQILPKIQILGH